MSTGDELKGKVEELRRAELALEDDLATAKQGLATAREREAAAIVTAALDGGSGKLSGKRAADIVETITATERAITEARSRRVDAIRAVWAAEAEDVRKQAKAKKVEAEQHAAKVAETLKVVEELENARYVPECRVADAYTSVGHGFSGQFTVPLSDVLPRRVVGLEKQAGQIAARQVAVNGSVSAATPDELLALVRDRDPFTLTPPLHAVRDWMDREEAAANERLARVPHHHRASRRECWSFTVSWSDGELNEAGSRATVELAEDRILAGTNGETAERRIATNKLVGIVA